MANNKVEFGISNLHVGTYTVADDGTVTMGTPYHQKGAVSFSPEQDSSSNPFYADDITYWNEYTEGEFSGDLVVAKFDDDFKKNFLGYKSLVDGGLAKVKGAVKPAAYVAFELKGDAEKRRVIFYNCSFGAITREYTTIEDTKTPNTETLPITISGDNASGVMQTTYRPDDAGYDDLFSNPAAPELESE